jgi:hypothetical protein
MSNGRMRNKFRKQNLLQFGLQTPGLSPASEAGLVLGAKLSFFIYFIIVRFYVYCLQVLFDYYLSPEALLSSLASELQVQPINWSVGFKSETTGVASLSLL